MEFQGEDDENRYKWVLHWNICWIDSRGIFRKEPSFLHIVDANKNVINTGKDFSLLVKSKQTNIKEEIFKRVSDCYDIPLLSQSRLVVIGVGGAGEYVEQMARSGVGQFVLIDPDVVELSNIATQQAYLHDVGRKKVSVVKQRLLQINPHVQVLTCPAYLDDYSDEQMQNLIFSSHEGVDKPSQTLICGFTDSFDAQKRINRLALQFAIPYISAQVYQQGVGCEVCFTHPDVTPACQRCALASRYAAYDKGDVKSVGSQGSPLHTTQRLNALKGFITMMLLHVHSDFPRYKGQLQKLWNRNMAIVRCDPAYKDTLKLDLFERTFGTINPYIYSDETVWVSIRPDDGTDGNPVCPDCGGTGNLYDSEGIFLDTIKGMRKRAEKEGEVCINSL
jgi:hypothetical protein